MDYKKPLCHANQTDTGRYMVKPVKYIMVSTQGVRTQVTRLAVVSLCVQARM